MFLPFYPVSGPRHGWHKPGCALVFDIGVFTLAFLQRKSPGWREQRGMCPKPLSCFDSEAQERTASHPKSQRPFSTAGTHIESSGVQNPFFQPLSHSIQSPISRASSEARRRVEELWLQTRSDQRPTCLLPLFSFLPSFAFSEVLGIKPRASCVLGRHSTSKLHASPQCRCCWYTL